MWLVTLAECVKAGIGNLFDTRADLLWGKGMTVTQDMFVFAGAVDEGGLSVEEETVVVRQGSIGNGGTFHRPPNATDAERGAYLVGSLAVTLNHGAKSVEIGVVETPAMYIRNGLCMVEDPALASLQRNGLGMPEDLFARGEGNLFTNSIC